MKKKAFIFGRSHTFHFFLKNMIFQETIIPFLIQHEADLNKELKK